MAGQRAPSSQLTENTWGEVCVHCERTADFWAVTQVCTQASRVRGNVDVVARRLLKHRAPAAASCALLLPAQLSLDVLRAVLADPRALPSVHDPGATGHYPLALAATACGADHARALLEAGADPRVPGDGLLLAVSYPLRPGALRALLDGGADAAARNPAHDTPLHAAAASDRDAAADIAELAAAHPASLAARNRAGLTPLHQACQARPCRPQNVAALLQAGADAGALTADARTALSLLASADHGPHQDPAAEAVQRLCAAGADARAVCLASDYYWTPLLLAASQGSPAVARALVAAGADVRARDAVNGDTALHLARTPEHVRALVECGADPNAGTWGGSTPLHRAAARGDAACIHALLEAGAVDRVDSFGRTARDLHPY